MRSGGLWWPLLVGLGVACSSCDGSGGGSRGAASDATGEESSGANETNVVRSSAGGFDSLTSDTAMLPNTAGSNTPTSEADGSDGSATSVREMHTTNADGVSGGTVSEVDDGGPSMLDAGETTTSETVASTSSSATGDGSTLDTSSCRFQIGGALSPEISTVGVVDWSVDLAGLTHARVEFSLADPEEGEVNIGGGGEISVNDGHALLLGLKPGRQYTYRIVVTDGETECASLDQTLVTDVDPETQVIAHALGHSTASRSNGFIVTCGYGGNHVSILDSDGAVVWWMYVPYTCSRALLDWDGNYMWSMAANPATAGAANLGKVDRVQMDGSGTESITGIEYSHHDFTVLPDGGTAFLIGEPGVEARSVSTLVERDRDGTFTTVVQLDDRVLNQTSDNYHANALRYHAHDDTYTVSDLNVWTIVKLTRSGERIWGAGPTCSESDRACVPISLYGNHGHQLLENGNLLYFGYSDDATTHAAYEYSLDLDGSAPTATLEWSYAPGLQSLIFGDVQRLPNGNTLVTFSSAGIIHEVSPTGELVQSFETNGQLGYAMFRTSLYGPAQSPVALTALRVTQ